MPNRLWDKGEELDSLMHKITVGNDNVLDRTLTPWDCDGSAAHARMLEKIGILSAVEVQTLLQGLKEIRAEAENGKFEIPLELEDCHTAIENRLVASCGDAGKKIHSGRSRNDQVMLAIRLFMRSEVLKAMSELSTIGEIFFDRFKEDGGLPMPGYTHMQPAMPSSIGMWLHAFFEGTLELIREGFALLDVLDSNPLGAGASFGSSLKLDRNYVSALLGFSRVQRSVIEAHNSRGKMEEKFLFWGSQIASLYEKFASDIVLYCTKEYGFFSLPTKLTTGSSIMPQKRNPDVAELLRARGGRMRAYLSEVQWVSGKLPSNYHRDLQLSKDPLIKGATELGAILGSVKLLIFGIEFNRGKLESAMRPELYATYDAESAVESGVPFRDAYRTAAESSKKGTLNVEALSARFQHVKDETSQGMKEAHDELIELTQEITKIQKLLDRLSTDLYEIT